MHTFIAFTSFLLLLYSLLILYYHWIWYRMIPRNHVLPGVPGLRTIPTSQASGKATVHPVIPSTKVSVIISARNEELHIGHCLQSLLRQSYPSDLTEIIVVNDFSTDRTASIVQEFRDKVRLLNLCDFVTENNLNAFKKKAIETGIIHSSGELIVCTDADCTAGPEWIETLLSAYVRYDFHILAAPVKILTDGSALSVFQALDFISLQGITAVAVQRNLYPMCNGANLAYSRSAFFAVDGFRNIDHIASGDDMLLMRKMQSRFPGTAGYVKDPKAIVCTQAAEDLKSFLRQRIRWASKISHYGHPATFLTLALVYTLNFCLLLLFLLSFYSGTWSWLVSLLILKIFTEFFFVSKVSRFFQQQSLMKYFIFCQPFHILYTVMTGAFGLFGKYSWKDREVK